MATVEEVSTVGVAAALTGVFWTVLLDHFVSVSENITDDATLVYVSLLVMFMSALTIAITWEAADE